MACELNFVIKGEGLLKVIGSHIHWKSGNTSQIVLDRDVLTKTNNRPQTGSDTRIRPI